MEKFKKGDKVKRIKKANLGMEIGDTDVITGISSNGLELEKYGGGHEKDYFELVSDNWCIRGCSELEEYFKTDKRNSMCWDGCVEGNYYFISTDGIWDLEYTTNKRVITFKEFLAKYDKPQTFAIKSDCVHLLESVVNKLEGYEMQAGYALSNLESNYFISTSIKKYSDENKEYFSKLIICDSQSNVDVTFQLPQDYQAAIDFAKAQLEKIEVEDIEFNNWCKITRENGDTALIFITGVSDSDYYQYKGFGCGFANLWRTQDWLNKGFEYSFTPATTEEVTSMLEKEAKKRGLVKGVMIKSFYGDYKSVISDLGSDYFLYDDCDVTDFYMGTKGQGISIFLDGKWAEIVKQTVTFGDKKYEVKDGCVLVEGDTISKEHIGYLINDLNNMSLAGHSVKIDKIKIGCQEGTLQQLKEAYDRL